MNSPARERRYHRIYQLGCLCCRKRGWYRRPEVHHQNLDGKAGQKRLGDEATIGLCPWHHQGHPLEGFTRAQCSKWLGPSLKEARVFREEFGSDEDLLAWQNELIAKADQNLVGSAA